MHPDAEKLVRELREAGLSEKAIKAAWPSWWSDEAGNTPSGRAELRFTLARKLGLSPKPLLGERVDFVWKDDVRFKHLTTEFDREQAALASFGIAVGRILLRAVPRVADLQGVGALALRAAILSNRQFVDLLGLLSLCWGLGVPVIHLRVFPLTTKSMHAMVVRVDGRHAVLLGRDAHYPAPIAFTLAHELGHIALGHTRNAPALVDLADPASASTPDEDEEAADSYALTLLTSSPAPDLRANADRFSAYSLAQAVLDAGPANNIEPGTLALCVGFRRDAWPIAMGALRHIYNEQKPVWREVNGIAETQLRWEELGAESAEYIRNIMLGDDA